jgi:hypothetical protein
MRRWRVRKSLLTDAGGNIVVMTMQRSGGAHVNGCTPRAQVHTSKRDDWQWHPANRFADCAREQCAGMLRQVYLRGCGGSCARWQVRVVYGLVRLPRGKHISAGIMVSWSSWTFLFTAQNTDHSRTHGTLFGSVDLSSEPSPQPGAACSCTIGVREGVIG